MHEQQQDKPIVLPEQKRLNKNVLHNVVKCVILKLGDQRKPTPFNKI